MPTFTQKNRPLSVTTPLGPDKLLLIGLSVEEGLSQLYHMHLEVMAPKDTTVAFDQLLGKPIGATLESVPGSPRYFHGICQRVSETGVDALMSYYTLDVVPQLWLLTKRAQSRIFQQMSVPDILKKVLDGITTKVKIQGTFQPRDYCGQYRETDFNFASRLMEEEGIYYYFEHTQQGHTMVLANNPQGHTTVASPNIEYEPLNATAHRTKARVTRWEKMQEIRSGKYTLWDHSFELPHKHLDSDKSVQSTVQAGTVSHKLTAGGGDQLELYDYPGEYAQRFDGVDRSGGDQAADLQKIFDDNKRTVGIRMQEEATGAVQIHGASDCWQFNSGQKFTLANHHNANGDYVLSAVRHAASLPSDYGSGDGTGFTYQNTFTCLPAALPFTPPRHTPKPFVQGTQTAVVVGTPGEEIFTDKYGRIKVQFHWDRQGKNDANSSCWVRVATPWAGKNWGMIHIPRVGQEVVVAFQEGDPDQPLVIGSVYNADQMPPYKLPDNKTQSGVKSRSSLKGTPDNFNELRFEDKKGSEDIYFHAETDFHRVVENNDFLVVGASKHKEGNQTIDIANNQLVTIGKPASDGANPALGSQIEEIWNNHEITIGSGKGQCADGSELVAIWNNQEVKIGAGNGANPDGSLILEIFKNRAVTLDTGNDQLEIKMGNQTTKLDLGASSTEALQSITLKVGQSSVTIDQTGVSIQGMMININGQLMTNIKGVMTSIQGSAMLQAQGGITMIN